MFSMLAVCSTMLIAVISANPTVTGKVTEKNWQHHPKVEASRAVYQEVTASLASHSLKERVRRAEGECWEWNELRVATDKTGVVRYFFRALGGQDSLYEHTFYYDKTGTLRFALLVGRAVSQSSIETRIWFDASAKELFRKNKVEGPGWTWIHSDPAILVRTPKTVFEEGAGACKFGPAEVVTTPKPAETKEH